MIAWKCTAHAAERATSRFGIRPANVEKWITEQMATAKFLSVSPDGKGRLRRMYVNPQVVLYAGIGDNNVVTVRKTIRTAEWAAVVERMALREVRKESVKAYQSERELLRVRFELENEMVDTKDKLLRARADSRITALQARLNALAIEITQIERDLNTVRRSPSKLAESFATVV
ncbi:hypothetical protein CPY53_04235 [Paenibacillus polymyxa]|uniref:hypothetical protein n=1 Tax=Paenibacillus polymyxa TaxID=1406 RepID=UPI001F5AAEAB|nr:hypothetical protein [Paenibacillus polymyxa]UNL92813.1 hypothetical protein CPY53_04235 [Paenibacillus polymyxa]